MTNRTKVAAAAAMLLLSARGAAPQSVPSVLETNIRNVIGDTWDVWTSPLRARPRDWLTAAGVVALSASVLPLDDEVDRWAVRHRTDKSFDALKELREGGIAFSGRTITPVVAGALTLALVTRNQRLQEGLFGCLTAYGASSAVRTYVVYPLVARTRPDSGHSGVQPPPAKSGDQYEFDFPGTSDWGRHSVPGGHITNVVACAEFLTRRFSMGLVEPVIWALAGGVAVGRTLDRRHWTSDQVIGAAFGYAVGKQIALRSSRRAARADTRRADAGWAPFVTRRGDGVEVGFARQF
jgi:membrane-associated phospholipid phosphatase